MRKEPKKFKILLKRSDSSEVADSASQLFGKTSKEFEKLSNKILNSDPLKAGTRGFHKSLYKKLANRIQEKPCSFYKYGFKEDEKKLCKTVFHELFELPRKTLSGTMSVTDLWNNANSLKYLKEN